MAFVPAITADDDMAPFITLENEAEILARVCFGEDDETGAIYSLFVALSAQIGQLNRYEISFDVIESLPDEGDNWCNDGLQTKRFLIGEHRNTALSCICAVLQEVVLRSGAEELFMMTVTPNLPDKALAKYERVCDAMRAIGFRAGRDSPYHGTQIWIMARICEGL